MKRNLLYLPSASRDTNRRCYRLYCKLRVTLAASRNLERGHWRMHCIIPSSHFKLPQALKMHWYLRIEELRSQICFFPSFSFACWSLAWIVKCGWDAVLFFNCSSMSSHAMRFLSQMSASDYGETMMISEGLGKARLSFTLMRDGNAWIIFILVLTSVAGMIFIFTGFVSL